MQELPKLPGARFISAAWYEKKCCVQIVLLFDLKKEERAVGRGLARKEAVFAGRTSARPTTIFSR
jgi:hypothetical protein